MTYDPFEDELEELILNAQTSRRAHTDQDDDHADQLMSEAAQQIVRNALTDRPGPIGNVNTTQFSISGNFRRVLLAELSSLVDAFNLTLVYKERGRDMDVLKLFGYASDVRHVIRFVESSYIQAQSAVGHWWLHSPNRGRGSLKDAYAYQRGYLIDFVGRLTARVRFAYSVETSTSTSLLLRRRLSALRAVDPRALAPLH